VKAAGAALEKKQKPGFYFGSSLQRVIKNKSDNLVYSL
jgi:hypothetical protein